MRLSPAPVPVDRDGRGAEASAATCPVCAGPSAVVVGACFCCRTVASQLRLPLVPVVAVTTVARRGVVARRLRAYKDAPVGERRDEATARLVGLLERWLAAGGRVPEGTLVTVPSTTRPGPPPVDRLVGAVPELAHRWRPGALAPGPCRADHLRASREGFVLCTGILERLATTASGAAVVVDDAYTTGARAQSAAAALRLAGIRVTGILVVARLGARGGYPPG